jgi:formate-dependent nitrite reductase membrane component NrfD
MAKIEWGILIVNYLFLGGLSAGIFFVSALATYLQQRDEAAYARIARSGAMMAPWPVTLGSLLLIFDLGNWYRFYKLFVHFRWQSPMSIGSWLLVLFTLVTLANFWAWLPGERRSALVRLVKLPPRCNYDLSSWRRLLAAGGFPLSIGVAIYTGVLLGAVQARPLWNTNLVAQLFLFSALSTGCAVLILVLSYNRQTVDATQLRFLYTLDICLITLEFFIVVPYLIHGELSVQAVKDSLGLILGGPYSVAFWLLFMGIGLLAPLILEVWEVAPALASETVLHHNRGLAAFTGVLVIFGGYVLRYVFVYAGQISYFK